MVKPFAVEMDKTKGTRIIKVDLKWFNLCGFYM